MKRKEEVKYLGCHLNRKCDITKEVRARIAATMGTLKKLEKFWKQSNCPAGVNIQVMDAVIRSKVLYGLETAHLKEGDTKKINAFQMKGLRKITKMGTTWQGEGREINRGNKNSEVIRKQMN